MRFRVFSRFVAPDYCSLAIAEATYRAYSREVAGFVLWCRQSGRLQSLRSVARLDLVLMEYLHWLHPRRGKGACQNVTSGLVHFLPQAKGRLPHSALAMRGIHRVQPTKQAAPVPWHVAVLLAWWQSRVHGRRYGVATVVGGHCMLRISELLGLRTTDIIVRNDDRMGRDNGSMILRLRKTKAGLVQSVSVDDVGVEGLLMDVLRRTAPGDRLFPFSAYKYRASMAMACKHLRLPRRFTPHGLRHGGATAFWMRHRNLDQLALRGRWSDKRSCLRYMQEGEMAYVDQHVPPPALVLALHLAKDVYKALTQKH
jgi:hypothetical protein